MYTKWFKLGTVYSGVTVWSSGFHCRCKKKSVPTYLIVAAKAQYKNARGEKGIQCIHTKRLKGSSAIS